jgi:hypothetical protein
MRTYDANAKAAIIKKAMEENWMRDIDVCSGSRRAGYSRTA